MSVYVGIDVHRKRSQVAVVDRAGRVQANRKVPNGVETVLKVIGDLPIGTPVAFEAAFGWGWLVELLDNYGFEPHLVHPSRCKAIASARLKNDKVDAHILAQLLRADLLPEAWIAPPAVRQLRARLRHRIQLGSSWCGCARCCATGSTRCWPTTATTGHDRAEGCWSGPGREWLAGLELPAASREVIDDCLAMIDAIQIPIERLDVEVRECARADPRVKVLTGLPGVGELTALVVVAEIGDIARFGSARKLAAWAGLTPTVRGSDLVVRHGHISKQGSTRLFERCAGSCARPHRPPSAHRSSPPPIRRSPAAAARRSPPPRSPASCSPAPTTCSPRPRTPRTPPGAVTTAMSKTRTRRPCRGRLQDREDHHTPG
jgi:transposase